MIEQLHSAIGNHLVLLRATANTCHALMDVMPPMSPSSLSVIDVTDRSGSDRRHRRDGRLGFITLGYLALMLAGCGRTSEPLSQPLDGNQAARPGPDQHLAENGNHERPLPRGGPSAGAITAAPQQVSQAAPAADDPTLPTTVEPLSDVGGFDPSPQGGGSETNHGTEGGDIAGPPGPQQ
jgi:hypothetical protein